MCMGHDASSCCLKVLLDISDKEVTTDQLCTHYVAQFSASVKSWLLGSKLLAKHQLLSKKKSKAIPVKGLGGL
jgi:hypothetical protein